MSVDACKQRKQFKLTGVLLHMVVSSVPVDLAHNRFANFERLIRTLDEMMRFGTFSLHVYYRLFIDPAIVTGLRIY